MALISIFTSYPWSLHGLNFSDAGFIYECGTLLNHGLFPYKNFLYNAGYLPVLTEAVIQKFITSSYSSSVYLAISLKTLTIIIFFIILKNQTNTKISFLASVVLSLLQIYVYHNGTLEVNFLISLLILLSVYTASKKPKLYFFYIGVILSLIIFSRQSTGIMVTCLVSVIFLINDIRSKRFYSVFIMFLGLILGLFLLLGYLFLNDTLDIALKQMFLDAKEKKGVSGISSILDMLLGGLTEIGKPPDIPKSLLINNAIPLILSFVFISALRVSKSSKENWITFIESSYTGMIFITLLFGFYELINFSVSSTNIYLGCYCILIGMIALFLRNKILNSYKTQIQFSKSTLLSLDIQQILFILIPFLPSLGNTLSGFSPNGEESFLLTYDIPRVFFTICLAFSILFPKKLEEYFGIPSLLFSLIIDLMLGNTWARELSHPQRGWIDTSTLYPLSLLFLLLSSKVSSHYKFKSLILFIVMLSASFLYQVITQKMIVGGETVGLYDGTLYENKFTVKNKSLKDMKVSYKKKIAVDFLTEKVHEGDSCFIYGAGPTLYTILMCKNPTKLTSTYPDYYVRSDIEEAIESLSKSPPKWIIHSGVRTGTPSLQDKNNDEVDFGAYQVPLAQEFHSFMKSFVKHYEHKGTVKDFLKKPYTSHPFDRDKIENLELYERK